MEPEQGRKKIREIYENTVAQLMAILRLEKKEIAEEKKQSEQEEIKKLKEKIQNNG